VLYASKRARPAVAQRLERDASRRERARLRTADEVSEETAPAPEATTEPEPALVGGGHGGETLGALAIQEQALEVGPSPSVQQALEEATRARLVAPPVPVRDPEKAELDRRQFINKGLIGGT